MRKRKHGCRGDRGTQRSDQATSPARTIAQFRVCKFRAGVVQCEHAYIASGSRCARRKIRSCNLGRSPNEGIMLSIILNTPLFSQCCQCEQLDLTLHNSTLMRSRRSVIRPSVRARPRESDGGKIVQIRACNFREGVLQCGHGYSNGRGHGKRILTRRVSEGSRNPSTPSLTCRVHGRGGISWQSRQWLRAAVRALGRNVL